MSSAQVFDLCAELSALLARAYEMLGQMVGPGRLSDRLGKMSRAKINHANIFRTGKIYLPHGGGADEPAAGVPEDVRAAIGLAEGAIGVLRQAPDLRTGLRRLEDIQRNSPIGRVCAALGGPDPFLKTMLAQVAREDREQAEVLAELISVL